MSKLWSLQTSLMFCLGCGWGGCIIYHPPWDISGGVPLVLGNSKASAASFALGTVYLFSFILRHDLTWRVWNSLSSPGLVTTQGPPASDSWVLIGITGRYNLEFLCQSWYLFWDLNLCGNKHLGTLAKQAELSDLCLEVAVPSLCSIGLYKKSIFSTWEMTQQSKTFVPKAWRFEFDPRNSSKGERKEPTRESCPLTYTTSSTSPIGHSQTHMHSTVKNW